MKNEIEINEELIAKYLTGEATPEEAMAMNEWLQIPANQLQFKKLQDTWNATFPSKAPRHIDLEMAWLEIDAKRQSGLQKKQKLPKRFNIPKHAFSIAASILLLITFSVVIYFFNSRSEKPVEISVHTFDTLQHVKFSDSSSVTLNHDTELSFPKTFDGNRREIHLAYGEAFFTIAPNPLKPFIIQTEVATIRVIGTAFNVVLDGDSLEVSVEKGKVLVYTAFDSTFLEPGYTAALSGKSPSFTVKPSNANDWAYASRKFVFKNTPLREVFSSIEKAQHCSIVMKNKDIGNCKLTATFESVSTDYILTLITEALDLSVAKNDNTFTVEGKGCQ